jgi:hypothetical protein
VATDSFEQFGTQDIQTSVEYPCFEGTWSSTVETFIYWPPGYDPAMSIIHDETPARTVKTSECAALVPVPDVVNSNDDVAENTITNAGLSIGTTTFRDDCVSENDVEDQNPHAGTLVQPGTPVDLTVSDCVGGGGGGIPK